MSLHSYVQLQLLIGWATQKPTPNIYTPKIFLSLRQQLLCIIRTNHITSTFIGKSILLINGAGLYSFIKNLEILRILNILISFLLTLPRNSKSFFMNCLCRCCISPILFSLYGEWLIKEGLEDIGDFTGGGSKINTIKIKFLYMLN